MTLTPDFVYAYLSESLTPHLAPEGYHWLTHKHQFRAKTTHGFRNLIFSVSPYDDLVLIEWHLGLRFDAVEDIVKRFTRTLPGFYPDAHTVIISQGKLLGQPYLRHEARNTQELDQVLARCLHFWQEHGATFLTAHHLLRHVDELLNQSPHIPSMYLPNRANRCLKGITVARLIQRADFDELSTIYAKELLKTSTGSLLIDGYHRLVGYLRKLSLN